MSPSTRREFLATVSSGVALTASGAVTAPLFKTVDGAETERKLGFALVGLGSLSTNQIAPALKKTKYCRLAAVVSGSEEKRKTWAKKYSLSESSLYSYETFDKLKDNPEVDVIYVVLPNAMHGEYTIKAAQAGKHVFCEKPMEVSSKKCQEMIDACKKANRLLGIGYRCQFVPHHQEMIRLAREKTFGPVKVIDASFGCKIGDPNQWRLNHNLAGGGALMDVGIYALQAARYTVGEEPVEIAAFETKTDKQKFKEVDETIFWTMRFPSGVLAKCGTTYNSNGLNRIFAGAEDGFFQLEPAYSYGGLEGKTSKGPLNLPQVDHFAAEMDDFAQCILQKKPTRVPGEEGLRDVKIIEAIYQSIREGGKTIKLT